MNFSPIAIFVYKRLWHTQKTIESLLINSEAKKSEVFIFSDGAKNETDKREVKEVRDFIHSVDGFKKVTIIERDKNFGLANSIIDGVTRVVNEFGRIIVLEDDMLVNPYFLDYMNQALVMYEKESKLACIHAWNYPLSVDVPETFFLRGADCWGWATWKRAWEVFEKDGQKLLNQIREKKQEWEFDRKGAYPYTQMLIDQIKGKNNSWAIRWHASAFLADMYCLHPGKTLLQNIGLDGSGTHSGKNELLSPSVSEKKIILTKMIVEQNEEVLLEIKKYILNANKKRTLMHRVLNKLKNILTRLIGEKRS